MPLFYVDTDDGSFRHVDQDGISVATAAAARSAALRTLPEMALSRIASEDRQEFQARIRDESGVTIYVATFTLRGEWIVRPLAD